jgi:CRISPR-associated endonuclease/helicase Cas3
MGLPHVPADELFWMRYPRYDISLGPYRARRFAVRVTPELIRQEVLRHARETGAEPAPDLDALPGIVSSILAAHAEEAAPVLLDAVMDTAPYLHLSEQMRTYLEALRDRKGRLERVFAYNYDERERPSGVVFLAPRGLRHVQDVDGLAAAPSTESDELGSAAGYAQPLDEHSNEVAACARHFGRRAGLGEAGTADLALAAYLHDAGKADPRFQAHHRRWRVPKGGENAKHSSRQSIRRAHVPWWRWRRRPGSRS